MARYPTCTYCGDWATELDHVIPRSYAHPPQRGRAHSMKRAKVHRAGDWEVPSCSECNNRLSDHLLTSVPTRAAYVLAKLEKGLKKAASFPAWSEEEMEEVGPSLKGSILASMDQAKLATRRLEHLKLVASMDDDYLRPD